MAVLLSISSQVVRGHVGNSAIAPGLRALGHEVWPLPTIVLSNHPGHGRSAGTATGADAILHMVEALDAYGWLGACAGVLTGYFRDAGQCIAAAQAVAAVRRANPQALYCCDPVLGDDPNGLYVPREVAEAVRDRLVPLADVVTPNRFELEWLCGREVAGPETAIKAGWMLGRPHLIATSVPQDEGLCNVWAGTADGAWCEFELVAGVPHGVGDLFAALAFAALLDGADGEVALGRATAQMDVVIAASTGRDELDMVSGLELLRDVMPAAVEHVVHGAG